MFELLSSGEVYFGKIMFMILCAYLVVIHTRVGLEFFEARGDATKCALILYKKIICFHT